MVQAIAAPFPFIGSGTLAPYYPSAVERYLPVAPGIEVSVEPAGDLMAGDPESSVYNRRGRMISSHRKGSCIDTYR